MLTGFKENDLTTPKCIRKQVVGW